MYSSIDSYLIYAYQIMKFFKTYFARIHWRARQARRPTCLRGLADSGPGIWGQQGIPQGGKMVLYLNSRKYSPHVLYIWERQPQALRILTERISTFLPSLKQWGIFNIKPKRTK